MQNKNNLPLDFLNNETLKDILPNNSSYDQDINREEQIINQFKPQLQNLFDNSENPTGEKSKVDTAFALHTYGGMDYETAYDLASINPEMLYGRDTKDKSFTESLGSEVKATYFMDKRNNYMRKYMATEDPIFMDKANEFNEKVKDSRVWEDNGLIGNLMIDSIQPAMSMGKFVINDLAVKASVFVMGSLMGGPAMGAALVAGSAGAIDAVSTAINWADTGTNQMGGTFYDLSQMEDAQGNKLDVTSPFAKTMFGLGSIIQGGIEIIGMEYMPGYKVIKMAIGPKVITNVLNKTIGKKVKEFGIEYLKGVGGETGEEGLQSIVEDTVSNLLKENSNKLEGTGFTKSDAQQILTKSLDSMVQASKSMVFAGLFTGGAGHGVNYVANRYKASKSFNLKKDTPIIDSQYVKTDFHPSDDYKQSVMDLAKKMKDGVKIDPPNGVAVGSSVIPLTSEDSKKMDAALVNGSKHIAINVSKFSKKEDTSEEIQQQSIRYGGKMDQKENSILIEDPIDYADAIKNLKSESYDYTEKLDQNGYTFKMRDDQGQSYEINITNDIPENISTYEDPDDSILNSVEVPFSNATKTTKETLTSEEFKSVKKDLQQTYGTKMSNNELSQVAGLYKVLSNVTGTNINDVASKIEFRFANKEETINQYTNTLKQQGMDSDKIDKALSHKTIRGWHSVEEVSNGQTKNIVTFTDSKNNTTLFHEMGHVFRSLLNPEQLSIFTKAYGGTTGAMWLSDIKDNGDSTYNLNGDLYTSYSAVKEMVMGNEENFADDFVAFTESGKATNEELKGIFQKFKEFLKAFLDAFKNRLSNSTIKAFNDVINGNETELTEFKSKEYSAEELESVQFQVADKTFNPKQVGHGYKMFEQDTTTGEIYPLFIGSKIPTPINKWAVAENNGKQKGFALRPGWHIGSTIPDAPWLKGVSSSADNIGQFNSKRGKNFKRVWAAVSYPTDVKYQDVLEETGKKDIKNHIPTNGFYNFRETNGLWIIAGAVRVDKVLTDKDRAKIFKEQKYDESREFAKHPNTPSKVSKVEIAEIELERDLLKGSDNEYAIDLLNKRLAISNAKLEERHAIAKINTSINSKYNVIEKSKAKLEEDKSSLTDKQYEAKKEAIEKRSNVVDELKAKNDERLDNAIRRQMNDWENNINDALYKPETRAIDNSSLRDWIPNSRGELTQKKIISYLKGISSGRSTTWGISKEIAKFDDAQDLFNHIYFHGTGGFSKGLSPSITFSDTKIQEVGGGGYGDKYWGISLSKNKRTSEHFSGESRSVSIYPIILDKNAKVVVMTEIQDALDLEDHIIDLWKNNVDAVWIGGGEQELVVLNPRAIHVYKEYDNYAVLGDMKSENMTLEKAEIIYNKAKENAKVSREQLKTTPLDKILFQAQDKDLAPNGNLSNLTDDQYKKVRTKAFKRWFGDWENDPENSSKLLDENGEPLVVFHGSTYTITSFDKKFSNIANDFGKGFYFSNEYWDVKDNYKGKGPDLTNRIQLLAERIEEQPEEYGKEEINEDDALKMATDLLYGKEEQIYDVFLSLKNPMLIGQPFGIDVREDTFLSYEEPYNEETEEYGEPKGNLLKFLDALQHISKNYDEVDMDQIRENIFENIEEEGIKAIDLVELLKKTEGLIDAIDEEGNSAYTEIIRATIEAMGYDGIIDFSVNDKFGTHREMGRPMEGMNEDTFHTIAFKPNQIKSSDNIGTFNPHKNNILYQTAWHGSSYEFDKFLTDHIGNGEGQQAYGWGLYFTQSEIVARDYANNLQNIKNNNRKGNTVFKLDGVVQDASNYKEGTEEYKLANLISFFGSWKYEKESTNKDIITELKRESKETKTSINFWNKKEDGAEKDHYLEKANENLKLNKFAIKLLKENILDRITEIPESKRNLYQVNLPDTGYLRWDKPVEESFIDKFNRAAYSLYPATMKDTANLKSYSAENFNQFYEYSSDLLGAKNVSKTLEAMGYIGIQYPVGYYSQGNTKGPFNFVLFNESDVEIKDTTLFQTEDNSDASDNFKSWFGNSKVVDQNGDPMIVYHGTNDDVEIFDKNLIGSSSKNMGHYGKGFYFSTNKNESKLYGENIIQAYLSIKKPFTGTNDEFDLLKKHGITSIDDKTDISLDYNSLYKAINKKDKNAATLLKLINDNGYEQGFEKYLDTHSSETTIDLNTIADLYEKGINVNGINNYVLDILDELGIKDDVKINQGYLYEQNLHWITELGKNANEVTEVIKSLGFDGVFYGSEIVAFEPNQIKSVDNTGSFDVSDPNILFQSEDKKIPLNSRLFGDDLLNVQDKIEDLKAVGGEVDKDGYAIVYHRTTKENAKKIEKSGRMIAKEYGLFFSSKRDGEAEGYGESIVKLEIPLEKLEEDDIFEDEIHYQLRLNRTLSKDVSVYDPTVLKDDILYQAEEKATSVVKTKGTLIALHNISEEKLLATYELGGMSMPSIAITKPEIEHSGFGNITLIGDKTLGNKLLKSGSIYDRDIWSPTIPRKEYTIEQLQPLEDELNKLGNALNELKINRYGDKVRFDSIFTDAPSDSEEIGSRLRYNNTAIAAYYNEVENITITSKEQWNDIKKNYDIKTVRNWLIQKAMPYFTEPKIKIGKQKLPYNVFNVFRAMQAKNKKGNNDGWIDSYSTAAAHAARNLKSRKILEKSEQFLGIRSKEIEEEFEEKDRIYTEHAIENRKEDNTNITDIIVYVLTEYFKKTSRSNYSRMELELADQSFDTNKKFVEESLEFAEALKNLPRKYFEAKPQEIMKPSDFKAAFVPESTSDLLVSMLRADGLIVEKYSDGDQNYAVQNYIKNNADATLFQTEEDTTTEEGIKDRYRKEVQDAIELGYYMPLSVLEYFKKESWVKDEYDFRKSLEILPYGVLYMGYKKDTFEEFLEEYTENYIYNEIGMEVSLGEEDLIYLKKVYDLSQIETPEVKDEKFLEGLKTNEDLLAFSNNNKSYRITTTQKKGPQSNKMVNRTTSRFTSFKGVSTKAIRLTDESTEDEYNEVRSLIQNDPRPYRRSEEFVNQMNQEADVNRLGGSDNGGYDEYLETLGEKLEYNFKDPTEETSYTYEELRSNLNGIIEDNVKKAVEEKTSTIWQERKNDIKNALISNYYVPDEIVEDFAGEKWADREIEFRKDLKAFGWITDLAKESKSVDNFINKLQDLDNEELGTKIDEFDPAVEKWGDEYSYALKVFEYSRISSPSQADRIFVNNSTSQLELIKLAELLRSSYSDLNKEGKETTKKGIYKGVSPKVLRLTLESSEADFDTARALIKGNPRVYRQALQVREQAKYRIQKANGEEALSDVSLREAYYDSLSTDIENEISEYSKNTKRNVKATFNKQLNDLTEQMIDAKIEEAARSLESLKAANLDLFKLQNEQKELKQTVTELTKTLTESETNLAKTVKNLERTTDLKANQKIRLEKEIADQKVKTKDLRKTLTKTKISLRKNERTVAALKKRDLARKGRELRNKLIKQIRSKSNFNNNVHDARYQESIQWFHSLFDKNGRERESLLIPLQSTSMSPGYEPLYIPMLLRNYLGDNFTVTQDNRTSKWTNEKLSQLLDLLEQVVSDSKNDLNLKKAFRMQSLTSTALDYYKQEYQSDPTRAMAQNGYANSLMKDMRSNIDGASNKYHQGTEKRFAKNLHNFDNGFIHIQRSARMMDSNTEGILYNFFVRDLQYKYQEFYKNRQRRLQELDSILKDLKTNENYLSKKALSYTPNGDKENTIDLTKEEVITAFIYSLNPKGLEKLMSDAGWGMTEDTISSVMDLMGDKDLKLAKELIRTIGGDEEFERYSDAAKNIYNVNVGREENYFPFRSIGKETEETQDLLVGPNSSTIGYVDRGRTKERVNAIYKLDLKGLNTWHKVLDEQERMISFGQWVKDSNYLLGKNSSLGHTISVRYGQTRLKSLQDFTNRVAKVHQDITGLEKLANIGISNFAASRISYSLSSAMHQITSITQGVRGDIDLPNLIKVLSLPHVVGGYKMGQAKREMEEKDPTMKNRCFNLEISRFRNLGHKTRVERDLSKFANVGMTPSEFMDSEVTVRFWWGVYLSELKKGSSEKESVFRASQFIAETQSTSNEMDLSEVQSGKNPFLRGLSQFKNDNFQHWNQMRFDLPYFANNKMWGKFLGTVMSNVLGAALFTASAGIWLPQGDDDGDKEGWTKRIVGEVFKQLLQEFLPLIGQGLSDSFNNYSNRSGIVEPLSFSGVKFGKELLDGDGDNEALIEKMYNFITETVGIATGFPTTESDRVFNAVQEKNIFRLIGGYWYHLKD